MPRNLWLVLVLSTWWPADAAAGLLYFDSDRVTISGESGRAGAKYRLSHTNFDQSLDNGPGTANPANFNRIGLGNTSQLSGRAYDFELSYRAGQGFLWSMTHAATGYRSVLGWGTFAAPPSADLLDLDPLLNSLAPNRPFNGIAIEARSVGAGSRLEVSNLVFESSLGVADGILRDINIAEDSLTRRILASSDLSQTNWALRGRVQAFKTSTRGDENVKLTLNVKQYDAAFSTAIPEPWTFATVGIALGGLIWWRRRQP